MRTFVSILLVLSLIVISRPQEAEAQAVFLVPAKDNTLYENEAGTISNGAGRHLFVGNTAAGDARRALLFFDVAAQAVPGVPVGSVLLSLNMSKTIAGAETVTLHRVTADWGEGASDAPGDEGAGIDAVAGDATWLHTFFNTATWQTPGGDFVATPSATASVDGEGRYTWNATPQLVADVQQWIDDPATNFGWIMIGNEGANTTAKRFDSREAPDTARPVLRVTFGTVTDVEGPEKPVVADLLGNHPNPFVQATTIGYALQSAQHVRLEVFDLLGRRQAVLVDGIQPAGAHSAVFEAAAAQGGVYFYRLTAGGAQRHGRMVHAR